MTNNSRNDRHNPLADLAELRDWAVRYMASRPADFVLGGRDDPQLERWFLIPRNCIQNVYLHRFHRSDENNSGPHDHPWDNRTLVLDGHYVEHLQDGSSVTRFPGDVVDRRAIEAHWVEIVDGPALSLFMTGPVIRSWGFYPASEWKPWRERVTVTPDGNVPLRREPR